VASIRKEALIDAKPDDVWAAVRDWGAVHERLVPGFVVQTRLEGTDRIVTFFNGLTARELLVDVDEAARRLVWAAVGGQLTHYNASAQVFPSDHGGTRFIWIADLLPHELAGLIDSMMERGIGVVKQTMEQRSG
jgi:carbon monoxide dehydrogenase subunit G